MEKYKGGFFFLEDPETGGCMGRSEWIKYEIMSLMGLFKSQVSMLCPYWYSWRLWHGSSSEAKSKPHLPWEDKKLQRDVSVLVICTYRTGIKECPRAIKDLALSGHGSERLCGSETLNIELVGEFIAVCKQRPVTCWKECHSWAAQGGT